MMTTLLESALWHHSIIPCLLLTGSGFVNVNMLRFGIFFQAFDAELPPDAALFVPAEGCPLIKQMPFVDPYRSGPQLSRNMHCLLWILRPDSSSKTVHRI